MTRRHVHLELMPKPRLVEIARQATARADLHAHHSEIWRDVVRRALAVPSPARRSPNEQTPQEVLEQARAILDRLPTDPDAEQHRADLWQALRPRRTA